MPYFYGSTKERIDIRGPILNTIMNELKKKKKASGNVELFSVFCCITRALIFGVAKICKILSP